MASKHIYHLVQRISEHGPRAKTIGTDMYVTSPDDVVDPPTVTGVQHTDQIYFFNYCPLKT